jgi:PKD repeat protein
MVQFDTPGVYTITLTVADSQGISDPTPASRTITVLNNNSSGGIIPQDAWGLVYTDSEETAGEDGAATNAFDGDPSTFWHTEWYNSDPSPPHEIWIDLGGIYEIDGFRYLPRQDGGINGTVSQYEFYISLDGINWGSPVAAGTFAKDTDEKEVLFPTATGRFIRLRALSEVNGNRWASMAEVIVFGK